MNFFPATNKLCHHFVGWAQILLIHILRRKASDGEYLLSTVLNGCLALLSRLDGLGVLLGFIFIGCLFEFFDRVFISIFCVCCDQVFIV